MTIYSIYDSDPVSAWMAQGICKDYGPDFFFPEDGSGVAKAQKVCAKCPVKQQCLDYALENRIEHGVWGGTSERKRRRIRKSLEVTELALAS